jgi:transcriptional regulator with XRE-family HTH domain
MLQIHERIKQEREKQRLSQDELAKILGVKRSTYAYWEEVDPKPEKVKQIAKALSLPENFFFVDIEYEKDDSAFDKPSNNPLSMALLNLTESNKALAEAQKIIAESNIVLARNNEKLVARFEANSGASKQVSQPSKGEGAKRRGPRGRMQGSLDKEEIHSDLKKKV